MNTLNNNIKFKENVKEIFESLINNKFEEELSRLKSNDNKVYRNGKRTVQINTVHGAIAIDIPRFRGFTFNYQNLLFESLGEDLNKIILSCYSYGLSTRNISKVLERSFGINISKSSIVNLLPLLDEQVDTLNKSTLPDDIQIIYIDSTYFSIKSIASYKVPLTTAIARTANNETHVIQQGVYQNEYNNEMDSFIKELSFKLTADNYIFVVDGCTALKEKITEYFPNSKLQRCMFHVVKNIKDLLLKHFQAKEINYFIKLFESIVYDDNFEIKHLNELLSQFPKYNKIISRVIKDSNIWTFTEYDCTLKKRIQTNNVVENYHSVLKSVTTQHKSFETTEGLLRATAQITLDYNQGQVQIDEMDNCEMIDNEQNIISQLEFPTDNIITLTIMYNQKRRYNKLEISPAEFKEIRKILSG